MALNGKVMANGVVVCYWEAVRKEEIKNVPGRYHYQCLVQYPNDGQPISKEFDVVHAYANGAERLASRVLSHASAMP